METRVLVVTSAKAKSPNRRRPVVKLQGNWLDEIGFSSGKLVAAEYGQGRIILRLQDSDNYKDLVKGALKASAGLFQVRLETNNKKQFSQIDIKGFWLENIGFTIGSMFAVRYEFGFIKLLLIDFDRLEEGREDLNQDGLSTGTRSLVVTHAKSSIADRRRPAIKFQGAWLAKIGFTAGKLVAAEYGQGQIIMRLHDSDREDLGKNALKASLGLFLVQNANQSEIPLIDIKGFWLEQFGFTIGKAFAARYEYGLIKLLLMDPERVQE